MFQSSFVLKENRNEDVLGKSLKLRDFFVFQDGKKKKIAVHWHANGDDIVARWVMNEEEPENSRRRC